MEDHKVVISIIAAAVGLASYVPYLLGITRGSLKPNAATWTVWSVLSAIAFAGQLSGGGGIGTLTIGTSTVASFVVVVLTLRHQKKYAFTRLDWSCLIVALLAICLWPMTRSPLSAEILVTAVTLIGSVPTFTKSYRHPEQENVSMYLAGVVKFGLSAFALSTFSAVTLLYPISVAIAYIALIYLLLARRKELSGSKATRQEAFSTIT